MRLLLDDKTTFSLRVMPVKYFSVFRLLLLTAAAASLHNVCILESGRRSSRYWFRFRGLGHGSVLSYWMLLATGTQLWTDIHLFDVYDFFNFRQS